ncbi:MAG: hypothetical protein ACI3ZR_09395 [bacterium]
MKKISLLLVALFVLLTTTAYAAEKPIVDYWHKVTVLSLETEDLQPSVFKLQDPVKSLEQSLISAQRIKKQLKNIRPPKELKENHKLRLAGMDYLIGGLTSFKDALANKNSRWQNTAALEKLQKATQNLTLAQMELADLCRSKLAGQKDYTYQEELCLYWADMTEKELSMNEDIQKLLQGSLELLKTKDAAKLDDLLLSFTALQQDIEKMSREMKAYQPSSRVIELHNKKLVVIDLACEVMSGVNEMLKNDKIDNIFKLMNKVDDFVAAQQEYNALFKTMLNQR